MTKMFMVRLMSVRPMRWRKEPGPETRLGEAFSNWLRAETIEGRIRGVWTHVPNEIGYQGHSKAAQLVYAVAKALGMIVGSPDYVFLGSNGSLALEAKSKTGTQTPGQKDFESWCAEEKVPYRIFKTLEQGQTILKEQGIWQPK